MQPRFRVQDNGSYWVVEDRNLIVERQSYHNPSDAQYVCDALNHFHRRKTGHFENAVSFMETAEKLATDPNRRCF